MIGHDLIEQVGGIEKAKGIVEGAPEGCTHFVRSTYLKLIGAVWWEVWGREWNHTSNCLVYRWKGGNIDLMRTWGEVFKINDLRTAIEHHDQLSGNSGEFKGGDLVVLNTGSRVYKINHIYRKAVWLESSKPNLDVVNINDVLRHATPEEIKASRRLDHADNRSHLTEDAVDMVTDIRNHISPMTKVVEL